MYLRRCPPLAAALLALLVTPAWAQSGPLTLTQAVALARSQTFTVQAGRERLASLRAQQEAVAAALYPQVGLRASTSYLQFLGGVAPGVSGGAASATALVPGLGFDTTLSASQLLFDGGSTASSVAVASDQAAVGQLLLAQVEQEAMTLAATGFFQVLRAESLQAVASDAVGQAQEHLRLGTVRLKSGVGTRAEVLDLKAKLANSQDGWLRASNASTLARLSLANAINAPVTDRPLAPSATPKAHTGAAGAAVERAWQERPELRAQATRVTIAQQQAEVVRATAWPNVTASGRLSQRNLGTFGAYAGVDLGWPVYDAARIGNRVTAFEAEAAAEQAQLNQLKQNVELEVRQALLTRDEARARLATAREGLAAAEEAYRIIVRRFELGLASPIELTDGHNTLLQARQNQVQATYDLSIAEVRLARAIGEDLAAYLMAGR